MHLKKKRKRMKKEGNEEEKENYEEEKAEAEEILSGCHIFYPRRVSYISRMLEGLSERGIKTKSQICETESYLAFLYTLTTPANRRVDETEYKIQASLLFRISDCTQCEKMRINTEARIPMQTTASNLETM